MNHSGLPNVAIIGRPNAGKSALFNRLVGRKIAIVHDQPGITRDRISAVCQRGDKPFTVWDTGGIFGAGERELTKQVHQTAEEALRLAQSNLGVGTALTVDVLQAEDALNDAQLRYASAATAYNQSQVNLLAALGLIDSVSLTPVEGTSSVPNIRPAASAR